MRIAIVGSGISGLTAAYLLAERHHVTLFEAGEKLGGHTNTQLVRCGEQLVPLDTGFIVYNERTYPAFTALLKELGVATQKSDMSFSVRSDCNGWEYCGSSLNGLFAQRRNLLRPAFHHMLAEIMRFNRRAPALLDTDDHLLTLGEYTTREHFSSAFQNYYLIPLGAAIWSAPPGKMFDFPLRYFVQFCQNHGLLSLRDRPQWRTVTGGAARYIEAMLRLRPVQVRRNCPVRRLIRTGREVLVTTDNAQSERFDQVVIAAHADQALRLLGDATPTETDVLGAFCYQTNEAVLHTDSTLMPRTRRAWASWNYHAPALPRQSVSVTYWLNRLHNLSATQNFCLTLNDEGRIDPRRVLNRMTYQHPLYTAKAVVAQTRHAEISGRLRTHFCGAYWGYGFHEDGVKSAIAVHRLFEKDSERCTVASTKAGSVTAAMVP